MNIIRCKLSFGYLPDRNIRQQRGWLACIAQTLALKQRCLLDKHGVKQFEGWAVHFPYHAGGVGGAARRLCSWGESHS